MLDFCRVSDTEFRNFYTLPIPYRKFENIFSERELRDHSPNSYIYVSVCDLYFPTIGQHAEALCFIQNFIDYMLE
jgi:hypothetical protein